MSVYIYVCMCVCVCVCVWLCSYELFTVKLLIMMSIKLVNEFIVSYQMGFPKRNSNF